MSVRLFASRALPLAIAGLLIAVGSATAGDYSPKQLRAESFLRVRNLDHEIGRHKVLPPSELPFRLGFAYPMALARGPVVLRVEAKPKLRRLVRFEVKF